MEQKLGILSFKKRYNFSPRGTGGKNLSQMTPREISRLSEQQMRNSLPDGWTFHKHNGRIHIKDANGNMRVRVDPPDARTNYQHIHIYNQNKQPLDINGNVTE